MKKDFHLYYIIIKNKIIYRLGKNNPKFRKWYYNKYKPSYHWGFFYFINDIPAEESFGLIGDISDKIDWEKALEDIFKV